MSITIPTPHGHEQCMLRLIVHTSQMVLAHQSIHQNNSTQRIVLTNSHSAHATHPTTLKSICSTPDMNLYHSGIVNAILCRAASRRSLSILLKWPSVVRNSASRSSMLFTSTLAGRRSFFSPLSNLGTRSAWTVFCAGFVPFSWLFSRSFR